MAEAFSLGTRIKVYYKIIGLKTWNTFKLLQYSLKQL